jgi:protein-S-isoprenylcysteine O-methyltransferase Ste14
MELETILLLDPRISLFRSAAVQEGPFKYVRRPGYLEGIVFWIGAGLTTVNWIVAVLER